MAKVLDKVSKYKYSIGGEAARQLAAFGEGFQTLFRMINRARRNYCGNPDGRVHVRLTDLGYMGDETGSRKERVDCEPN